MWVVVHHGERDGSGGVGDALTERGLAVRHVRPYRGEALPAADEVAGVVVLGAAQGAADGDAPHLEAERRLLRRAAVAGLPVLGICFGAQLLAVALGGAVGRAARPEIGSGTVGLTAAGRGDRATAALGDRAPVLHWHSDTYRVPPGATSLATSSHGTEQCFRWGRRTYGVQFHVEITAALHTDIRGELPAAATTAAHVRAAAAAGARFLAAFLDEATAP